MSENRCIAQFATGAFPKCFASSSSWTANCKSLRTVAAFVMVSTGTLWNTTSALHVNLVEVLIWWWTVCLKYTLNAALFALIDTMVYTGVLKMSIHLPKHVVIRIVCHVALQNNTCFNCLTPEPFRYIQVNFIQEQTMMAQRGIRGITLLFL
jgi:hypothetical protein